MFFNEISVDYGNHALFIGRKIKEGGKAMKRNREEWDELFKKRTKNLPPEDFLVEYKDLLRGPRILDLACGDGRNSFYLAELGFQVCAVDFSEVALNKVDAGNYSNIETILGDLANPETIEILNNFDSIIINHFIPSKEVFHRLLTKVHRGGHILLTAFTEDLEKSNLLTSISQMEAGAEIVVDRSYSNSWGYFKGIIIKRRQL